MKVLIVEDESQTALRLEKLLYRYDSTIHVLGKIPSVAKTLAYFSEPNAVTPDLIFIDIHLEDDLGFRIFEKLEPTIPIIFTTAYSNYMPEAFKTFSIDYLLKPIDFQELCEAIDKYKRILRFNHPAEPGAKQPVDYMPKAEHKDRFMVSIGSKIQSILVSRIAYFSYEEKTAFLITTDGHHYAIDYSLDKLVQLVDSRQFFRVNRSFIISLSAIKSVHTYSQGKLKVDILPKPRSEVFVSTDRVSSFKDWLGK